ncbi:MAG: HAD family hydrolase [Oligoflexia bacterium]|nr:HAD family hydrolase [Oligoflexia bacterium]
MLQKKLIIFDLDGTLLDSKLDFPAIRRDLEIPEGKGILEHIAEKPSHEQEMLRSKLLTIELDAVDGSPLFMGVKEVLLELSDRGFYLAIFTRNTRKAAEKVVRKFSLPIDLIVGREDALPKPSPDGLLLIGKKLKIASCDTLFIGDYLYDLEAGRLAGVDTWLYLYESENIPDFAKNASRIIFSFSEICEILRFKEEED